MKLTTMTNERESDCKCDYYRKNGMVTIAVQILSIAAFFISGVVGFYPLANIVLGCLTFAIHQMLWCTRVHKNVFWFLVVGCLVLAEYYFHLGYVYMTFFGATYVFSILCYVAGALWMIMAMCHLVFMLQKIDNEAPVTDASEEIAVAKAYSLLLQAQ